MGVLGDKPGTGKTYEIAGLIERYPYIDNDYGPISQYGESLIQLQENTKNCINLDCNLIVVPHYLVNQWLDVLQKIPNYVYRVQKQTHIEKFNTMRGKHLSKGSIVIVSSTFYNRFVSRFSYVCWSRVIYDEADKIEIPSCIKPRFKFVWFITASITNLMFPSGEYYYRESSTRRIKKVYIDGVRGKGFIKNVFTTLECKRMNTYLQYIYIKCNNALLDASFRFPKIEKHTIMCEEPMYVKILDGLLGNEILQYLNVGDVSGAIQRLGANIESKKDIITVVTENIEKEIYNKRQKIIYLTDLIIDAQEKERRVKEEKRKIESLESKLENIKERLDESECPICFEKAENPVILKCCHRVYCLQCISSSMKASMKSCPICRGEIEYKNICVLSEEPKQINNSKTLPTKDEQLNTILKKKGKHLIFSAFDISDKIQQRFENIVGNHARIDNIIKCYNTGDVNILLLNPYYYGNGLNLTETTDIIFYHKMTKEMEEQIIGRVCRIGKKDVIKVYYLYYNNEIRST